MKVWRDKEGNWIERKEFMSRWKRGLEKVTPLQQTKSQMFFSWIAIIGIVCGIVVSIITIKNLWWLGIILLAALGNTIVGLIGIYQRYRQLKRIDFDIAQSIKEEHDIMKMGGMLKNEKM